MQSTPTSTKGRRKDFDNRSLVRFNRFAGFTFDACTPVSDEASTVSNRTLTQCPSAGSVKAKVAGFNFLNLPVEMTE